jgi:dihydrofolate synthase/folylpolyglutamate synthase
LLVIGILADKKLDEIVKDFVKIQGDIVATEPDSPRKLSSDMLCKAVNEENRYCLSLGPWENARDYILQNKNYYDGIIVSGSLYLIGKIREWFTNEN